MSQWRNLWCMCSRTESNQEIRRGRATKAGAKRVVQETKISLGSSSPWYDQSPWVREACTVLRSPHLRAAKSSGQTGRSSSPTMSTPERRRRSPLRLQFCATTGPCLRRQIQSVVASCGGSIQERTRSRPLTSTRELPTPATRATSTLWGVVMYSFKPRMHRRTGSCGGRTARRPVRFAS